MAEISVEVEETVLENDNGYEVDSVSATCTECDHKTESFGKSDGSLRRCLWLMRDECPMGQRNYYVADA